MSSLMGFLVKWHPVVVLVAIVGGLVVFVCFIVVGGGLPCG